MPEENSTAVAEGATPTVEEVQCKRCGWTWTPRKENPKWCPACNSPYWNKERERSGNLPTARQRVREEG